jgi:hypothetical protein
MASIKCAGRIWQTIDPVSVQVVQIIFIFRIPIASHHGGSHEQKQSEHSSTLSVNEFLTPIPARAMRQRERKQSEKF